MTHKFATLILAASALGLVALPAVAAQCVNNVSLGVGYGADASPDSFSCTLDNGDITLSNFTYLSSTPVTADEVTVGLDNPGSDGYGLTFSGAWSTAANTTADVDVTFDVTASNGQEIGDVYIILSAPNVNGGTGNLEYTESFCNPQPSCSETSETVSFPSTSAQNDLVTLSQPVTSLAITKDVELIGGSNGVSFSSFGNQYSTVPEPRAVSLVLGLGLLIGFAFFKRRQVA